MKDVLNKFSSDNSYKAQLQKLLYEILIKEFEHSSIKNENELEIYLKKAFEHWENEVVKIVGIIKTNELEEEEQQYE